MVYKILVMGLSLLFAANAIAKQKDPSPEKLASKAVSIQSMNWVQSQIPSNSQILHIELHNASKRMHYVDAVYSPLATQAQLKRRVGKKGAKRFRSTYMVRLNPATQSKVGATVIDVKMTGLSEPKLPIADLPLVLLFKDGSSMGINIER